MANLKDFFVLLTKKTNLKKKTQNAICIFINRIR